MNKDAAYEIWSERMVIADCLMELGLKQLANKVHTPEFVGDIINEFIKIIQTLAERYKNNDVLDRLYFHGLIYG